jgi:hypothetical protein
MEAITKLSQLDTTASYTYADYLRWQFEERVELPPKVEDDTLTTPIISGLVIDLTDVFAD